MMGRSMDHVASFVTGMSTNPDIFDSGKFKFKKNLISYYNHIKTNDIFASYAVVPPQAARNPEFYQKQNLPIPTLSVVDENEEGVVISGMKMLATSAVFANEIWIGNLVPLAPDQVKQQQLNEVDSLDGEIKLGGIRKIKFTQNDIIFNKKT